MLPLCTLNRDEVHPWLVSLQFQVKGFEDPSGYDSERAVPRLIRVADEQRSSVSWWLGLGWM